jgi:hypothetical protein
MKHHTSKFSNYWPLAVLCTLVFSGVSLANPLENLKKVGEAKLKVLFWDVYNSSLYSETGEYQAEQFPQALKINMLRDIDAEDLIERTQDEWDKLGIKKVIFSQWIPLLINIFPDIKKGDTLLFRVSEKQQSEFFFNGKTIGKITDQTFGKNFLRIWLDKNCSYPSVRNKLIGSNK